MNSARITVYFIYQFGRCVRHGSFRWTRWEEKEVNWTARPKRICSEYSYLFSSQEAVVVVVVKMFCCC